MNVYCRFYAVIREVNTLLFRGMNSSVKWYIIKKISPLKKFPSEFLIFNGINHELIDVKDNIPKLKTQVVRSPQKNENSTMYLSVLFQSRS